VRYNDPVLFSTVAFKTLTFSQVTDSDSEITLKIGHF